ncbi:hypothetical protein [Mucisphaera calidilacus]|uniref:Uncharacterized protein n=1 Tax=Mucisphaera calidilacus TaxID=2527982 RepID=A0A518C0T1_9BACT|nr:hypothetical protein [Mucisphaera calidilacus]QDU72810.1 hypothetical protein Pan265_26840 [Mucisphaera calidilacus]
MTISVGDLDEASVEALAGTRDAATGFEYAERGRHPYYRWLMNTLRLLSASSLGDFRVLSASEAEGFPAVTVLGGRASLGGVVVAYEGGLFDLSLMNNAVVFVWLRAVSGAAVVEVGAEADGWPGGVHLKLAEVEVSGGRVVSVLDRRKEVVLSV